MKRSVVRNMDTNYIPIDRITDMLEMFSLKHAAKNLPSILENAEINDSTYRELLYDIFSTEIRGRNERRRSRNYAAAHFPPNPKPLELFDPQELESGITASQIKQLRELNWIDTNSNIVLVGPPGLGKTMIAVGLGIEAVNYGYTVCFERMSNFVKILDNAETERNAGFRLKNMHKAQLIILDEIGYTPISRPQANRFFNFISDTYETSSIIFTTNKDVAEWAEMMGDPILTTAMLDRILHHSICFSLKGDSYRLKHPEMYIQ